MNPKPLTKLDENYVLNCFDKEKVIAAVKWLQQQIFDLYRKFPKGQLWSWSNDQVCDECEEYVAKKIKEAFPFLEQNDKMQS